MKTVMKTVMKMRMKMRMMMTIKMTIKMMRNIWMMMKNMKFTKPSKQDATVYQEEMIIKAARKHWLTPPTLLHLVVLTLLPFPTLRPAVLVTLPSKRMEKV